MRTARERVATRYRSQGKAKAERIRANIKRERTVILAQAYKKSQEIRGQGDGKAASISAKVYGQSPEFYRFYRSLRVYRKSWNNKHDLLVLEPDSALFKYFKSPKKR
jgi:membrane protease subunit HflC